MNYKVMHKDTVIALADENGITSISEPSLCPKCFVPGMPLGVWLENRMVDIHRSHSRKLFKALRMRNPDDIDQVIRIGHGISITDNWWIQKADENLDYQSLRSYNEEIADIALNGASNSETENKSGYLELGTVGSYEKAWRFENGNWLMYKRGNTEELISEYFCYAFLKKICAPVAEYEVKHTVSKETGISSTFIVTKDFTGNAGVDFEPFCNYYTDHEEPEYIIPKLDPDLVRPYVMMLFYDVLLYNGDRHNQNVGYLRDSSTGNIIGLAPYFDYNLALYSTNTPRIDPQKGNVLANAFLENEDCRKVLKENLLKENEILTAVRSAISSTSKCFKGSNARYAVLKNYIINTYKYISDNI